MMAAFHSVPRDQWLETTIADIRAHMGLPSSPQLDKFTRWFLFLAHLQHTLVGVRDNSKVLNYFCMLLTPRAMCVPAGVHRTHQVPMVYTAHTKWQVQVWQVWCVVVCLVTRLTGSSRPERQKGWLKMEFYLLRGVAQTLLYL